MRIIFLLLIVLLQSYSLDLYGQNSVSDIKGSVDYEKYIKFNFQEHSSSKTHYNIAFFAKADSEQLNNSLSSTLQFWGHGREFFSILGPLTLNLKIGSDSLSTFKTKMNNTYDYFRKEIVRKDRLYEHVDIIIFDDFIFSCYMDRDVPRYAFWYKEKKYNISEESIEYLNTALEEYFQ